VVLTRARAALDTPFAVASKVPPGLTVMPGSGGYEGVIFYRLALNPFTREATAHGITIDNSSYRQQRVGYPLLIESRRSVLCERSRGDAGAQRARSPRHHRDRRNDRAAVQRDVRFFAAALPRHDHLQRIYFAECVSSR
jgi:hypothetical protein